MLRVNKSQCGCPLLRWSKLVLLVFLFFHNAQASSWEKRPISETPIDSLNEAILIAIQNDPWRRSAELKQRALRAESRGLDTLDDPTISIGLQNLPTSGFAFDQEPMTQFKVGIVQSFSQGETQALNSRHAMSRAQQYPYQIAERELDIVRTVSAQWIELQRINQQLNYVDEQRALFTQLVQIVKREFASAQGNAKQENVLQAELENIKVDDLVAGLEAEKAQRMATLSVWLDMHKAITISQKFTQISMPTTLLQCEQPVDRYQRQQVLSNQLMQHPKLLMIDQQIETSELKIALAKQAYKPKWSLNASYGYRADDPMNNSRADFLSVGVNVQMPLFDSERQDSKLKASKLQHQSVQTDKQLVLRHMIANINSVQQRLCGLSKRLDISQHAVLPKLAEHAQAALTSFTNDEGSFETVMRARIDAFQGQLDFIQLSAEQLLLIVQLRYFFPQYNVLEAQK